MKKIVVSIVCGMLLFASLIVESSANTGANGSSNLANHTGSFSYAIPIHTPRGSGGFQPSLELKYNSSSPNGVYGLGWNLSLARIERSTKNGAPKYNNTDSFYLFLNGNRYTLLDVGGGEYRLREEGLFLKITKTGNYWLVKDGSGKSYYFGWNEFTQNSAWPVGQASSFRWNISKATDLRGNFIQYYYIDDANGHRIDRIKYSPTNEVIFSYEDRGDKLINYRSGYKEVTNVRLIRVENYVDSVAALNKAFHLYLRYSTAAEGPRSLLREATVYPVTTALGEIPRVTIYEYDQGVWGQSLAQQAWNDPTGNPGWTLAYYLNNHDSNGSYRILIDMDGDGLLDRVTSDTPNYEKIQVFLNTGNGFSPTAIAWHDPLGHPAWSSVGHYVLNHDGNGLFRALVDMDGDGRPDRVTNSATPNTVLVYLNTGSGFAVQPILWNDPKGYPTWVHYAINADYNGQYSTLIDMNGDGLVDRVTSDMWTPERLRVFLNTGSGFSSAGLAWHDPAGNPGWTLAYYIDNYDANGYYRMLIDMNGDGLPDRVTTDSYATNKLKVYLNTGTGFDPMPISWDDPAETTGQPLAYYVTLNDGQAGSLRELIDMDDDGLPDRVTNSATAGKVNVYLNTGSGFSFTPTVWDDPLGNAGWSHRVNNFDANGSYRGLNDMNGDGAVDRIASAHPAKGWMKYYPSAKKPALLSKIITPTGLTTQIEYTSSRNYVNTDLPLNVWVVSKVTTTETDVEDCSTSIDYSGGLFDRIEKELRGFATVTVTDDQTGIVTESNFYQTQIFQGRPSFIEQRLINGRIISQVNNTWLAQSYDNGLRNFAYINTTVQKLFEPSGTGTLPYSTVTTTYTPDAFGNMTTVLVDYGGGDSTATTNTTSNNATAWLLGQIDTATVASSINGVTKTRKSSFTYYPVGDPRAGLLKSEMIEPNAADQLLTLTTTYDYDTYGNRTYAKTVGNTLDVAGLIVPQTRESWASYAALNGVDYQGRFPTSSTNAAGHFESYQWDTRLGFKTFLQGPNQAGVVGTTWTADGFGRVTEELRADGTSTVSQFGDVAGNLFVHVFHKDTAGAVINEKKTTLDARGRSTLIRSKAFDGTWAYVKSEYNAKGRLWRQSESYSSIPVNWISNVYDEIGRTTSATSFGAGTTLYVYSGLTLTEKKTGSAGLQTTVTVKNLQGQIATVTDSNGGVVTYTYDPFGNLTSTMTSGADFISVTRSMTYDIRGRKTGMTDKDMGTWTYRYSAFGELVEQIDAKQQKTTMLFDELGRMTNREARSAQNLLRDYGIWIFDTGVAAKGKLSSESSAAGSKNYGYDTLGRVSSVTTNITGDATPYAVANSYDPVTGELSSVSYPENQLILNYAYQNGYLKEIRKQNDLPNTGTTLLWTQTSLSVDGASNVQTFGSNLHVVDRVLTRQTTSSSLSITTTGAAILNRNYTYDALGNMTVRDGSNYGYDTLERLLSKNSNIQYQYDGRGNILEKDGRSYTYDANHSHAVATVRTILPTGAQYNYDYDYDLNGNMLNRYPVTGGVRGAADRSFAWTVFNKPQSISTANGYTSYTYDASHQRLTKSIASGTNNTVYIGKLYERSSTFAAGVRRKAFIYAGGQLIALQEQVDQLPKTISYMHADNLGSMIASTNASTGAIEGSIRSYDAFGLEMGFITSDVSGRGYTGHEQVNNQLDAEFGLINMNARLYDPEIGRFISADTIVPDPLNMQGYNRYSYVINNPLKYIDPTGHGWFGAFKRNISKRIRWTKIRGKAIGGTLMVAGAAISLSGFPEFGVPIMSSGAYLGGWTNGAEANVGNASWGSSPGGGTSITYGSIFGSGSYSSSGGWSYNGYSGGGSLGTGYSTQVGFNGATININNGGEASLALLFQDPFQNPATRASGYADPGAGYGELLLSFGVASIARASGGMAVRKIDSLGSLLNASKFDRILQTKGNALQFKNEGSARSAFVQLKKGLNVSEADVVPIPVGEYFRKGNQVFTLRRQSAPTVSVKTDNNLQQIAVRFGEW